MIETGFCRDGHTTCPFCATEIAAPVRSELGAAGHTLYVWHCPSCTSVFETLETDPSEFDVRDAIQRYWPNLLVA
jgi:hypothetical protein